MLWLTARRPVHDVRESHDERPHTSFRFVNSRRTMSANLRLCTFNVWGRPYGRSTKKGERIELIARALAKEPFDVVALQEDANRISSTARGGGLRYNHYFNSGIAGSGLLILSRFPILETSFWAYGANGKAHRIKHGDYYGGNGIAQATVQTLHGPIDIVTTQLIGNYTQEARDDQGVSVPKDEYAAHRVAQAFTLAQFVRLMSRNAVIVMGDFASRPKNLEVRLFECLTGMTDAFAAMCPGNPGYTVNSSDNTFMIEKGTKQRADYVFFTPAEVTPRWEPVSAGLALTQSSAGFSFSNHYGVTANLRLLPQQEDVMERAMTTVPRSQYLGRLLRLSSEVLQTGANTAARRRRDHTVFGVLLLLLAAGMVPIIAGYWGWFEYRDWEGGVCMPLTHLLVAGFVSACMGAWAMAEVTKGILAAQREARVLTEKYHQIERILDSQAGFD